MELLSFQNLVQRSRRGESDAAEQLIRRYEPALRREIRMFHTDPNLRRVFDTSDLVQSVLGNFFIRLAAGQFDIEQPGQLVRLLAVMAVNRLRDHARSNNKGGGNRITTSSISRFLRSQESPSQIVANRDLLHQVRDLLTGEELEIADKRLAGLKWVEIAQQMGGTAESRRKQHARALNRVAQQLNLDEIDL